ncbi:MAG: formylmethanofuran dehydrogenase subunit C [Candidatus Nezhaarchaeales archaeon]|nr:MAG: formylmethanofuran dehydrogenase subunit C [Candidatus Nezhaarchaeota archaeon WYZ-LMO8]TDA36491.1 MAG: formylmethanofuran dehydrogenase subunit C [Candidatus Nezhaarchaeota archaeon WYZ-LMO7]
MPIINLNLIKDPIVPIEIETIIPNKIASLTLSEVAKMVVWVGKKQLKLSDVFQIEGEVGSKPEEVKIVFKGYTNRLRRVGEKMSTGEIEVLGDVGPYAGRKMKGGRLVIRGSAGPCLGAKMYDGIIEVFGSAEDRVGGSYRGELPAKGMRGGTIIVHGNAGAEVGLGMRGGTIIVDGSCDIMPGLDMSGGTILIKGDCTGKAGARMTGGRIIVAGRISTILPSFYVDEIRPSIKVAGEKIDGPLLVFVGDVAASEKCSGRLMVNLKNNPHLKRYEELLAEKVEVDL